MTVNRSRSPQQAAMRRVYYGLTLEWALIAATASQAANGKVDGDYDFVCEAVCLRLFAPAADAPNLIYTNWSPLPDPSPIAATGNAWPSYDSARLQLVVNDNNLFRTPVRCGALVDGSTSRHYLLTKLNIGRGITVQGTLYNDSAAKSLGGQLLLEGYYAKPR